MEFQLSSFKSCESAALNMPANLESSAKKAHRNGKGRFFISIIKKRSAKERLNYCTIAHSTHTSKVMLKILQASLQQYANRSFQMFKLDLEKVEEWQIKCQHPLYHQKSKKLPGKKKIYFCFIDQAKAFDCVDHYKLWKILQEVGIPDQLTCLLRNLHAGQETTVRTRHGTMDWSQIGKGVHQGWILSPYLINLYSEYIKQNAKLDEAQAGIKTAGRISIISDMQMTPPIWQKAKKN